jgi:hypothetical protein
MTAGEPGCRRLGMVSGHCLSAAGVRGEKLRGKRHSCAGTSLKTLSCR